MVKQTKSNKSTNSQKNTTKSLNTFKVLYYGSILVLNGKEKFARANYFVKRGLALSKSHVIFRGVCYYLVEKPEVEMSVFSSNVSYKLTA